VRSTNDGWSANLNRGGKGEKGSLRVWEFRSLGVWEFGSLGV
jgi:hypothetical protein